MPIFDNVIFATFIPQILMFLGVISCFSAPLFANNQKTEHPDIIEIAELKYSASYENVGNTVYLFSDYSTDFEGEGLLEKSSNFYAVNPVVSPLYYKINFHSHNIFFVLFSRPPPAFAYIILS